MNSIELHVEGMTCGACVRRVREALEPLAGVREVAVDLAAGRVRVGGEADSGQLIAALQKAGYPARPAATPDAPAAAKAGGCGGSGGCCCR